ncbi:hypothetical protein [Haladaptatus sp. R4]|nr:hypothetical protein [Haladaptatus sp. R4]
MSSHSVGAVFEYIVGQYDSTVLCVGVEARGEMSVFGGNVRKPCW